MAIEPNSIPTRSGSHRPGSGEPQNDMAPWGPASSTMLSSHLFDTNQEEAGNEVSDLWNGQSLDSILGASVPDFDMTLYQALGQSIMTQPYLQAAASSFQPVENALDCHPIAFPPVNGVDWDEVWRAEGNNQNLPTTSMGDRLDSNNTNTDEIFLNGFCEWSLSDHLIKDDRCLLGAWIVTYPPSIRNDIKAAYYRSTKHRLNHLCRQAAAVACEKETTGCNLTTDLALLQRAYAGQSLDNRGKRLPIDAIPQEDFTRKIDPEPIIREATLMAREPKE